MKRMSDVFYLPVMQSFDFLCDAGKTIVGEFNNHGQALHAARAINNADKLADALQKLFSEYKQLADSGDAGKWKAEEAPGGEAALAALKAYRGEQ